MTFTQIRNYIKGLFNPIVDELKQDIEDANGVVPINFDDFNRLPQSEKDNGKAYFIPDVNFNNQNRPTPTGFTPIGTIISVMGNHAPSHYLICDGTTYNISQYPDLAAYFEQEFGSKNKFGGDGTTTFKVPDLRGEFLRGTGTNSRSNCGNGSNVGVHQDPTNFPNFFANTNSKGIRFRGIADSAKNISIANFDSYATAKTNHVSISGGTTGSETSNVAYACSTRPTNTSVLYCIATCNIYIDTKNSYSTQETVIGEWIDGKPLYQKTVVVATPTATTTGTYVSTTPSHGITNANMVFIKEAFIKDSANICRRLPYVLNGGAQIKVSAGLTALQCVNGITDYNNTSMIVTLQYTKSTD